MTDFLATLPHDHAQARVLRAEIRAWFLREGLSERLREDTLLVASELFSNAVRAAEPKSEINAHITQQVDGLSIALRNVGPGFDIAQVMIPSIALPGGRGIAIAQALGTVTVHQQLGYTTVSVRLKGPSARTTTREPATPAS